jgi:hypothetical protein
MQTLDFMLAQIFNSSWTRFTGFTVLASVGLLLASCVHDTPPLIADPNSARDSSLPWNQQQKWEQGGQAGEINTEGRR